MRPLKCPLLLGSLCLTCQISALPNPATSAISNGAIATRPLISKHAPTTTATASTETTLCSAITSTPVANPTTSHSVSYASEAATLTTSLSPTVSAAVFPDWNPEWYLEAENIPSGKWGLPMNKTNGKSLLGSFDAPRLPQYLGAGGEVNKSLWISQTVSKAKARQTTPNTGVTRYYDFVIERTVLAPDGVPRPVILVNGAFPAPTIEADWGDTIQVTVTNKISGPDEGVSLHWHGLLQKETPYMDGVPGVSQCPIAPGQTYTYSFSADLYGTSWYHSHYSAQYAAGVFGAMIIHGPTDNTEYDEDLGPVILSDYYHREYFDILEDVMGTVKNAVAPKSDNNLINGKGLYNCSYAASPATCNPNAGLSKFRFEPGKSYRLRLINAGAEGIQKFSIDNHKLTVIAYDFVPIVPYDTEVVTLGVGQRADVVVTAGGAAGSSAWMRSTISSCSLANQPNGLAMVYYTGADYNSKPDSTAWIDTTDPCANDDLAKTTPYYSAEPPTDCDVELEIDITVGTNQTGHLLWSMNNSTFRTDYNNPILPAIQSGQQVASFPAERNIYDLGNAKSVRVTINNRTPVSHPMHIHGHNMYVLSSTSNQPGTLTTINPANPTRRDTQLLMPNGQIVIQIDGDNPGVWPLHCHIAWHVSAGLYVNLLERSGEFIGADIPPSSADLCQSWQAWTDTDVPDQIDSGL